MSAGWSEETLRARLAARAAEMGKTVRAVLTEGGLSHDTIDKPVRRGRRIDTLVKIAAAFRLDLGDLLGVSHSPIPNPISAPLLQMAYSVARRAFASELKSIPDEQLMLITARIYDVLAARRRNTQVIDENVLSTMVAMLASEYRPAPPGSHPAVPPVDR
jgi:hypothetical protein